MPRRARADPVPYAMNGTLPVGVDEGAARATVQARQLAKLSRDFVKADALRAELVAKGIRIDDRTRCCPSEATGGLGLGLGLGLG